MDEATLPRAQQTTRGASDAQIKGRSSLTPMNPVKRVGRPANTSKETSAVLKLFEGGDWQYGYEICKSTGFHAGTVYPMLQRLERDGILVGEWQTPVGDGRPPRKVYQLAS